MQDIIYLFLDTLHILLLLAVVIVLLWKGSKAFGRSYAGWNILIAGLALICFANLIDLIDDYPLLHPALDLFSPFTWTLLEKIIGYLFGTLFIFYGIYKLIPALAQVHNTKNSLTTSSENLKKNIQNQNVNLQQSLDKLTKSEQRFEIFSELSNEGIAIHRDGLIIEANQAFCRHSGYAYQELIGMGFI